MKKFFRLFLILFFFFPLTKVLAQEEVSYKGVVQESKEVPCSDVLADGYNCFEYVVFISDLDLTEKSIPMLAETDTPKFKEGDKVYITSVSDEFGNEVWSITGYNRNFSILILVGIFALLSVIIGGKQGVGSLISFVLTILILYIWAIPKFIEGKSIMIIGIMTVGVMLFVMIYLSHGFNRKSTIGAISTSIGVIIVGIFAKIFMNLINIDGSGSEEAFLLFSQTDGGINLSEIYFISILISAVGVLDDVVMSQISSVQEIFKVDNQLSTSKLYLKSMNIGKDHISSMINTLFVAYAGSSLALVMLLTYSSGGIGNIIKTDIIAEEIVRIVVPSLGILLIVPIATFLAAKIIPLISKRERTSL